MKLKPIALALTFCSFANVLAEPHLDEAIDELERAWAILYYQSEGKEKVSKFKNLAKQAQKLADIHPQRAEPLIWQAINLCTYAGEKGGLEALSILRKARDLLLKAIKIDPAALDGSALITLGSLYYMVPPWPIAFGSEEKAQNYLQAALKIDPNGIDANYFYGDFLLGQGKYRQALEYFRKAIQAPIRPHQYLADSKLKEQAEQGLEKAQHKQESHFRSFVNSLFSWRAEVDRAKQIGSKEQGTLD